ncbi:MAG: D-2-hydroxyacid dehydrogenase [Candidatus Cryptobacteroides sp.]
MKIVFLDAATIGEDISLEPIASLGDLTCWQTSTPQESLARVKEAEVLIINKVKVTAELIDAAPNLKLICEAATGVNNIDLGYAASRNIPVRNVAGYSTESVVQVTFMHILNLLCKAPLYDSRVKSGAYSRGGLFTDVSVPFPELAGKRMGIIGMGSIGHRVAEVASAFGMAVSYFSTSGTSHCSDFPSVGIEQLLAESDIVSIHAPLNQATLGLIDSDRLKLMKSGAILVNMGRGGIVDEPALARAIDDGTIAGAALDVFAVEPLPEDNPLLHLSHPERLSLTPHTGWASVEARRRLVDGIAGNIRSFMQDL